VAVAPSSLPRRFPVLTRRASHLARARDGVGVGEEGEGRESFPFPLPRRALLHSSSQLAEVSRGVQDGIRSHSFANSVAVVEHLSCCPYEWTEAYVSVRAVLTVSQWASCERQRARPVRNLT